MVRSTKNNTLWHVLFSATKRKQMHAGANRANPRVLGTLAPYQSLRRPTTGPQNAGTRSGRKESPAAVAFHLNVSCTKSARVASKAHMRNDCAKMPHSTAIRRRFRRRLSNAGDGRLRSRVRIAVILRLMYATCGKHLVLWMSGCTKSSLLPLFSWVHSRSRSSSLQQLELFLLSCAPSGRQLEANLETHPRNSEASVQKSHPVPAPSPIAWQSPSLSYLISSLHQGR